MEVCLPVPEAVCRLRWEVQHNNPYAYDSYSAYSYNSSNSIFGGVIFSSIVIAILLVIALLASLYTIFVGNAVSVGGCRYLWRTENIRQVLQRCFMDSRMEDMEMWLRQCFSGICLFYCGHCF